MREPPLSRSEIMARIRAKDTAPEMAVRRRLHALGFRFSCSPKRLPGRPDIVLARYRIAIFVNGCFWHSHGNCAAGRLPKSNLAYWEPKLAANVARDRRKTRELRRLGWSVRTVWECQIVRNGKSARIERLIRAIATAGKTAAKPLDATAERIQ